ncbi:DNA translocase FtsK [Savagea faecisuis]|uniref:DNA translocase FtsK n=1 Tax=Savagea faecisuis TaxID=1274803 RepID=A0ABW3H0M2_9BACL
MSFFNKIKKVFHTEDERDEYIEQEEERAVVQEAPQPEVKQVPAKKGGRTKPFTFPLVERQQDVSRERMKWEERILCTDELEDFVPRPLYENERWPGRNHRSRQQAHVDRQILRRKKEVRQVPRHVERPSKPATVEVERPKVFESSQEERKPFKLSDVPSPIYGFQQPIRTLQELKDEPLPLKDEWRQQEEVEKHPNRPIDEDQRSYNTYKEQTVPYVKKLQAHRIANSMNEEKLPSSKRDEKLSEAPSPQRTSAYAPSDEQVGGNDDNQRTDDVIVQEEKKVVAAPKKPQDVPVSEEQQERALQNEMSERLRKVEKIEDDFSDERTVSTSTIEEQEEVVANDEENTNVVINETEDIEEPSTPEVEQVEVASTENLPNSALEEEICPEKLGHALEERFDHLKQLDEKIEHVSNEISTMTQLEEEKEKEEKPSTIPFNVVMLKSDKEKLQKRETLQHQATQLEKLVERAQEDEEEKNVNKVEEVAEVKKASVITEELLKDYQFPSLDYLTEPSEKKRDDVWLDEQAEILEETLAHFNIEAKVEQAVQGPSVTRFEMTMERGTKVSKIRNLTDDLKLALAARDIRIEAPIPGTSFIGIEIPNRESHAVELREILESEPFQNSESPLEAALGLDITGEPITIDLSEMPHGLIAGATGSGKSVCINCILTSLLYKASPDELKLLLIDPKMVELAPYNGIAHLLSPVITDVKAATLALKWAVNEMEERYQLFAEVGARNIERYNEMAKEDGQAPHMPYLLIVIDELADLMMMAPQDVELSISRIAQKARAAGIHLLIATQRPSVDVITGTIKANVPTRIAFSVSSQIDSRTILDQAGAERLLGRGDMLYAEGSDPVRLQGAFVSDNEIERIIDHVKRERDPQYAFGVDDLMKIEIADERDPLFEEVCEYLIGQETASTSALQRQFNIGYNRAARIMEQLEELQFISEQNGTKPRTVFLTEEQLSRL